MTVVWDVTQSITHVSEYKVGAHCQNMKRVLHKYRPFSTTLHYLNTKRRNIWGNTATQKPKAYPDKIKQMKKWT